MIAVSASYSLRANQRQQWGERTKEKQLKEAKPWQHKEVSWVWKKIEIK